MIYGRADTVNTYCCDFIKRMSNRSFPGDGWEEDLCESILSPCQEEFCQLKVSVVSPFTVTPRALGETQVLLRCIEITQSVNLC